MDETYPIREDVPENLWGTPIDVGVVERTTTLSYENDGLDYEVDLSTIDDQYAHHLHQLKKMYIILSITKKRS